MTRRNAMIDRAARLAVHGAAACLLALSGCAPAAARSFATVALPSGEPQTPCETSAWVDLEETRLSASTTTGSGWFTRTVTTSERGLALYRRREGPGGEPIDLGLALPSLAEPSLTRHMRPVDDLRSREHTALMVLATGGVIAATSTSAGALLLAVRDVPSDAAFATTMVGVGVGTLVMVATLLLSPSAETRNHATLRAQLFVPGEDDLDAVRRGVTRYNLATRARCRRGDAPSRATR